MAKVKGGRKLARSPKDEGYYQRQFIKTGQNKLRRSVRRKRRLESMPKQQHPVKPNGATRIVRRNLRARAAQLAKTKKPTTVLSAIPIAEKE